jgi:hypothetical protein
MIFKVGDVCVIIEDAIYCPAIKAGSECTIVSLESQWPGQVSIDVHGFPPDNSYPTWACPPEKLRLKRPPEEPRTNVEPADEDFEPADEDFCEWLKAQRREKA